MNQLLEKKGTVKEYNMKNGEKIRNEILASLPT
jgi:hypothetical protein